MELYNHEILKTTVRNGSTDRRAGMQRHGVGSRPACDMVLLRKPSARGCPTRHALASEGEAPMFAGWLCPTARGLCLPEALA